MYHKWELIIDGQTIDATNDVTNWEEIMLTLQRGDYDGVVRSYTSKFEFEGASRDALKAEYEKNELYSSATIVFLLRNNRWLYDEQFRCPLKFSEYEDNGFIVTIGCIDTSLNNIIKSKGSTEYEFDVSKLSGLNISYDGLSLEQKATWYIQGESQDDGSVKFSMPASSVGEIPTVHLDNSGEVLYQQKIQVDDQKRVYDQEYTYSPLIKYISETSASLVVNFSYMVPTTSGRTPRIGLYDIETLYDTGVVDGVTMVADGAWHDASFTISASQLTVGKSYIFFILASTNNGALDMYFTNMDITLTWNDASGQTYIVPVITPRTVLSSIMSKIAPELSVTTEIDYTHDDRLNGTYILAAESIRGIDEAKFYTSFNKFRDWMKAVFGYVYSIEDNKISFKHRSDYFSSNLVKSFTKAQITNYNYHLDEGVIFASVTAGFDDQTYDVVNGRDEFRFGITFTTGVTTNENTLELKSPYRCDAYGFEVLASKRGEDTTDNSSDKDVFFLKTILDSSIGYPVPDRTVSASGLISPTTQFNLMFSPRRCLLSNIEYIAACMQVGKLLSFASSEGNSDVVIDGVSETSDITITSANRLFKVGLHSFEVPMQSLPTVETGVVEFEINGAYKYGYIENLEFNCGKEKTVEYQLIETGSNLNVGFSVSDTEIDIPQVEYSDFITFVSKGVNNVSLPVKVASLSDWLSVSISDNGIEFEAQENQTGSKRIARVFLTQIATKKKIEIRITQEA